GWHEVARDGAGRHAGRQAVPPEGQGHAGAAFAADGRPLHPDPDRDPAEADEAPARTSPGVRAALLEGEQSGIDRLLRAHEGILRGLINPIRNVTRARSLLQPGLLFAASGRRIRLSRPSRIFKNA